uniref:Uncharacterized protein n=1 Tax=Candidatus Kentrum sp. MB TaxID=2138164 RepID=A0A450XXB6_9GAMM|nr:MAG: hypothetical protein BECKMB1821G_GA0114241_11953 [Candidatus Kentron sp. MB]
MIPLLALLARCAGITFFPFQPLRTWVSFLSLRSRNPDISFVAFIARRTRCTRIPFGALRTNVALIAFRSCCALITLRTLWPRCASVPFFSF